MNKNLGKILLFLLVPLLLGADNSLASYQFSVSKTDVYEREAVEVSFSAQQKDHEDVMFFFLEAKQSDDYEISLLNKSTKKLGYHNVTTTFNYLLFLKKPGQVHVDFDFTIKTASDDAVAQIYVGSRDNVKLIETTDTVVNIDPLSFNVKGVEAGTSFVGDFKISSKVRSETVDQFSTVQVSYILNGVGYIDKKREPLPPIKGATLFDDIVDHTFKATKNGYVIEREFAYAISADKSFTLPNIRLKAFSPRTHSYYELSTKETPITIDKIDPKTLLDDKESPAPTAYDFSWIKDLFIAVFIFVAGFLTGKFSESLRFKWLERSERFSDVKKSSDAKTLLKVLLVQYKAKELAPYINTLEMMVYKSSKQNFKEVKREVLKLLHSL